MLPTHAGDTSRLRCSSDHPSVHPRSRGEHTSPSAAASASFGSSPLARGTLAFIVIMPFLVRLIPARAGNTRHLLPAALPAPAHPRSRGEHSELRCSGRISSGSSPLARGTPANRYRKALNARLIPARAGNTYVTIRAHLFSTAHPRSRGEHTIEDAPCRADCGSSPLARGTLDMNIVASASQRLIPARAGNTYRRAFALDSR